MYEGDAPLAERRAAALALDRDLLRDLLGAEELRELIDPGVLADLELELQRLADGRRARDADELPDLLRALGPLTRRRGRRPVATVPAPTGWASCVAASAGSSGGRWRARSASPRPRTPPACATPSASPCRRACPGLHRPRRAAPRRPRRPLRPHPRAVPHRPRRPAPRASGASRCCSRSRRSRARAGSSGASSGPTASSASGATTRCCASCAAARWPRCARRSSRSTATALARFLPAWQGVGVPRRGPRRPGRGPRRPAGGGAAGVGPRDRRPPRPRGRLPPGRPRRPVHRGRGGLGRRRCPRRHRRPGPPGLPGPPRPARPRRRRAAGRTGPRRPAAPTSTSGGRRSGPTWWPPRPRPSVPYDEPTVLAALWDLVWAGVVTNDSLGPAAGVPGRKAPSRPASAARPRVG